MEQLEAAIQSTLGKKEKVDVEEIQDVIQKELIKRNKYDVVEEFIVYRNKRAEVREQKSGLVKNIRKKLDGKNIENQNANVDEASFGGRIGEASRIVCKNDALKYRMSKKARKAHENNESHIHVQNAIHNLLYMGSPTLLPFLLVLPCFSLYTLFTLYTLFSLRDFECKSICRDISRVIQVYTNFQPPVLFQDYISNQCQSRLSP